MTDALGSQCGRRRQNDKTVTLVLESAAVRCRLCAAVAEVSCALTPDDPRTLAANDNARRSRPNAVSGARVDKTGATRPLEPPAVSQRPAGHAGRFACLPWAAETHTVGWVDPCGWGQLVKGKKRVVCLCVCLSCTVQAIQIQPPQR